MALGEIHVGSESAGLTLVLHGDRKVEVFRLAKSAYQPLGQNGLNHPAKLIRGQRFPDRIQPPVYPVRDRMPRHQVYIRSFSIRGSVQEAENLTLASGRTRSRGCLHGLYYTTGRAGGRMGTMWAAGGICAGRKTRAMALLSRYSCTITFASRIITGCTSQK